MEDILKLVENHGVSLVGFVAVSFALYKVLIFMLKQKADDFAKSHAELKELSIKNLEKLGKLENKVIDHIGDQTVFRDVIIDLLKGK